MTEDTDLTEAEMYFLWRRELVIGFAQWMNQTPEFKEAARAAANVLDAAVVEENLRRIFDHCGIVYSSTLGPDDQSKLTDEEIRKGLGL